MRKPKLKPNSPELDTQHRIVVRQCDIPGCSHQGEHRAPKSRQNLRDYFWFCLDHVREYNRNWDFFNGMNEADIEEHIRKSTIWDEVEALTVLNITPPTDIEEIKVRYKKMAKKYHPDLNNGCRKAEEKLKKINIAYTVLKIAYQNYQTYTE